MLHFANRSHKAPFLIGFKVIDLNFQNRGFKNHLISNTDLLPHSLVTSPTCRSPTLHIHYFFLLLLTSAYRVVTGKWVDFYLHL